MPQTPTNLTFKGTISYMYNQYRHEKKLKLLKAPLEAALWRVFDIGLPRRTRIEQNILKKRTLPFTHLVNLEPSPVDKNYARISYIKLFHEQVFQDSKYSKHSMVQTTHSSFRSKWIETDSIGHNQLYCLSIQVDIDIPLSKFNLDAHGQGYSSVFRSKLNYYLTTSMQKLCNAVN